MPALSPEDFLTENRHKSFSNKLFINTAKYLGFRIFRFKSCTKVGRGMSKQGRGHHPRSVTRQVCQSKLSWHYTDHSAEWVFTAGVGEERLLRSPEQATPKDPQKPVFPRFNIPLTHLQNISIWLLQHQLPKKWYVLIFWMTPLEGTFWEFERVEGWYYKALANWWWPFFAK